MPQDHELFPLGRVELQSGGVLPAAVLAYKTYGQLNEAGDNAVLLPTFYTGTHLRNEGFFAAGRAIDPARHFVVSVNMLGNGLSSSPSNTPSPTGGRYFPHVTLHDNVRLQFLLLSEVLKVRRLALVAGWSMAGCQAYQWAAQYPDMVDAILPFCASAKTSLHNIVFLEGVKAALQADAAWNDGAYESPPVKGLKAFGRVYAGWAYSQTFFRERLYRKLGFATFEDLLVDWENDHLTWDANNLLAMLWSWQNADISANTIYAGDFTKALAGISARAILIPCSDDLYFPPEDNAIEANHMRRAELRVFQSPWGHCVASPGNEPAFARFLDDALRDLMVD
jgi:homoserine O-acetyltransferase